MSQRTSICFLLVLVPALAGCTRSAGLFSEQNARAHVSMLAGTIGSRPVGTEANARARAYVIDQGRVTKVGLSASLASDPAIREAYMGIA